MTFSRKTGMYYVEGLSSKSNRRIVSRNFKTEKQAISHAKKLKRQGKIVQAEIIFTKNIISDVTTWNLDTIGKVKRYNQDKGMFEEWGGLP